MLEKRRDAATPAHKEGEPCADPFATAPFVHESDTAADVIDACDTVLRDAPAAIFFASEYRPSSYPFHALELLLLLLLSTTAPTVWPNPYAVPWIVGRAVFSWFVLGLGFLLYAAHAPFIPKMGWIQGAKQYHFCTLFVATALFLVLGFYDAVSLPMAGGGPDVNALGTIDSDAGQLSVHALSSAITPLAVLTLLLSVSFFVFVLYRFVSALFANSQYSDGAGHDAPLQQKRYFNFACQGGK